MDKYMKKDWSAFKITVILYVIVVILPLNYYFAKQSFDGMKNNASTMSSLTQISGDLLRLTTTHSLNEKEMLIKKIDDSLLGIKKNFIEYKGNQEYITLFRTDESYKYLYLSFESLKKEIYEHKSIKAFVSRTIRDINSFTQTIEKMTVYTTETILERLYVSIIFSMISIIILIFAIRIYMKLQLIKHTVHDHTTELFNKKYFDNVILSTQKLSTRQKKPLSLLVLNITNYDDIYLELNRKNFEEFQKEFGDLFNNFFRRSDIVCRIHKETFASIAPESALENINMLSQRLQNEIDKHKFKANIKINISIGVATYDKDAFNSLLEEANQNMIHTSNKSKERTSL